jgi:pimeloyl-ACP methyl ester carboxylesterase
MGSGPVREIEVEERRLTWRAVGKGPALLLVNGYAASGEDWDPSFLDGLAQSFEVICPDSRGIGDSELGDAGLTVDGMAGDLEALLDALGVERVPLVGWSMGGFVAQRLAMRAPARVTALALLATDPGGAESVLATPATWSRLTDQSGSAREQASRLISLLFPAGLAAEIDRQFGEVVAAARTQLSPQTLLAQEAAIDAWHRDESPGLGRDEVPPTLVIHGDLDVVIPPANAKALAARWPSAQVEIFSGCAHAVMAQEPQRAVELIGALVER